MLVSDIHAAAGFVPASMYHVQGFTDRVTPPIRFAANRWVAETRYAAAVANRDGDPARGELLNRAATMVSHFCQIESFRGSYCGFDVETACAFLVQRFGGES